jgi:hypothetical protein
VGGDTWSTSNSGASTFVPQCAILLLNPVECHWLARLRHTLKDVCPIVNGPFSRFEGLHDADIAPGAGVAGCLGRCALDLLSNRSVPTRRNTRFGTAAVKLVRAVVIASFDPTALILCDPDSASGAASARHHRSDLRWAAGDGAADRHSVEPFPAVGGAAAADPRPCGIAQHFLIHSAPSVFDRGAIRGGDGTTGASVQVQCRRR